jgi:hypothetical protein
MDKSSGFIATEEMSVPTGGGAAAKVQAKYADCGANVAGIRWQSTNANYNICVKELGRASNVQVTVFWKSVTGRNSDTINCTSAGVWETATEAEIKRIAEAG